MKLYEAKVRCREEFQRTLDGFGVTMDQFRAYVDKQPELSTGLLTLPHEEVGVAANLLHLVAKRMKKQLNVAEKKLMSVQEVEKIARAVAAEEGAACVAEAEEPAAADSSCSTDEEDCPTCSDSLPGEQKDRTADATVKAATGEGCGDSCGCE
jgi:hypothetical protein